MAPLDPDRMGYDDAALRVLAAYAAAIEAGRAASEEHTGWVERLRSIPGIAEGDLPRIHGRLIAFGMLRFHLEGRASGMEYQLTGAGRRLLDPDSPPVEPEGEGMEPSHDSELSGAA